jgi:hypothetical protein
MQSPLVPQRRTRRWLVPVGTGLVGVAAIVGFLALRGGDDAPDTTAAAATLRSLAEEVTFPEGETFVSIEGRCPFTSITRVRNASSSPVSADTTYGDDVVLASISDNRADPTLFQCFRTSDSGTAGFGLLVGVVPKGSFSEYVDRAAKEIGSIGDKRELSHLGGIIVQYRIDITDVDQSLVESDWSDGTIQIGLFASDATPDETTAWLRAMLPDIIRDLNELKADDVEVTTST